MAVRNIQKNMKQANQGHMENLLVNEYSSNISWTYWVDERRIIGYSTKRLFETMIAGIKLSGAFS